MSRVAREYAQRAFEVAFGVPESVGDDRCPVAIVATGLIQRLVYAPAQASPVATDISQIEFCHAPRRRGGRIPFGGLVVGDRRRIGVRNLLFSELSLKHA